MGVPDLSHIGFVRLKPLVGVGAVTPKTDFLSKLWLGLGSEEGWRGGLGLTSLKDGWPSSKQV